MVGGGDVVEDIYSEEGKAYLHLSRCKITRIPPVSVKVLCTRHFVVHVFDIGSSAPTASLCPLTAKAPGKRNIHRKAWIDGKVIMIIKGLFRRYERWNPVHPTSGAFWGMGIGFGCGVGWGPGFGPEVIGYVGAGCGFGFSVGITLAGFGIGLPANYVVEVPYSAVMATRSSALEIARSSGLLNLRNGSASGWSNIGPHISGVRQKALGRLSSSKLRDSFNLSEMPRVLSTHTRSILDHLQEFGANLLHPPKGFKD